MRIVASTATVERRRIEMVEGMGGYYGKMLDINLTDGEMKEVPLEKTTAQRYLGGVGLGCRLVYDNVPAGTDPLSPENLLVFPGGPFHATGIPWSNRWVVASLSPETGFMGWALSGGSFGPALKRCGYDAVIFRGKSPKPVYLHITEDFAELKDASHLWGMDTFESETTIRKELKDPDVRITNIGQAGEHMVRFAAVMDDMGRAAGRNGMGAVMGSKNLKAIAASGHKDLEAADPIELFKLMKGMIEFGKDGPIGAIFAKYGTAFGGLSGPLMGDTMFSNGKYWSKSYCTKGKESTLLKMASDWKEINVNNFHCEYCPTGCGGHIKIKSPDKYAGETHRWEYEAAYALGNCCLMYDVKTLAKANDLCNRYGMDVITSGNVLAFSMMCREKGWISQKDTDGIDLVWGNGDAEIEMLHKIAYREGFGNILADGIKPAAQRIGHRAEKIIVHAKGMPPGGWDSRFLASVYLAFSLSPRGGDHNFGGFCGMMPSGYHLDKGRRIDPHSFKGTARGYYFNENNLIVMDSLPICEFSMVLSPNTLAALLSAVTGWNVNMRDLMRTGDRIRTMERLVSCRFGCSRKDDFMHMPFRVEASDYWLPKEREVVKAVKEYYHIKGWSDDGVPTMQKIQELGIENVKEALPTKSA